MNLTWRGLWLGSLTLLVGALVQWIPDPPEGSDSFIGPWLWRLLPLAYVLTLIAEGLDARRSRVHARWRSTPTLQLGIQADLALELTQTIAEAEQSAPSTPTTLQVWIPQPDGVDAPPLSGSPSETTSADGIDTVTLIAQRLLSSDVPIEHSVAYGILKRSYIPTQLGQLPLPTPQLRRRGRWGLAWWNHTPEFTSAQVPVKPALRPTAENTPGNSGEIGHSSQRQGSGGELHGLREYRNGDPLRMIVWKASARRQRTVVREVSEEQQLDILIVIDAGRAGCQQIGPLTRLHHAVNVAARLADEVIAAGDHVGLLAYDGSGTKIRLPPAGGLNTRRRIRETLANLRAHPEESDPQQAALAINHCARRRALILWFTDTDTGTSTLPIRSAAQLLRSRHLPLFAGLNDPGLNELKIQAPQHWTDPYTSLAAARAIEAAELQTRQLRQAGCLVIQSPPDQISGQLLNTWKRLRAERRV